MTVGSIILYIVLFIIFTGLIIAMTIAIGNNKENDYHFYTKYEDEDDNNEFFI